MRKTFSAFLAPALALALAQSAHATANYVYHQRASSQILQDNGGTPGSSCGSYLDRVYVAAGQTNTIQFKVDYQFYTNAAQLYYTTDGTTPSGAFGIAAGASTALVGASNSGYRCSFFDSGANNTADVVTDVIPAQTAGKVVKYIASAYNTGGGDEIFANGCGNCGTPNNSAAAAQVFSYTVEGVKTASFSQNNVAAGGTDSLSVFVVPGTSTDQNGTATDTVTSVTADLSSLGGASNAALTASGNTFSKSVTVASATTAGAKTVPITVAFASGNTATANATVSVSAAPAANVMYQLLAGYNDIDVANDNSGTIQFNIVAGSPGASGLGATSGQERAIAVRPANVNGDGKPAIVYIARGGASTGDTRPGGAIGVAAVALADLTTSYNPNVATAKSNFQDTGLVTGPPTGTTLTFVQAIAYDAGADRVWVYDKSSVPTNVFSFPGGTFGGAGYPRAAGGATSGGASASNSAIAYEFTALNDLSLGGSARGIAARTVGTGAAAVTTLALAVGNHMEVYTGKTGGPWTRVYATKALPINQTVASRETSSGVNGVAISDDGYVYVVDQQNSFGNIWRFPTTSSKPNTTALDVDDRALGGTNGGFTYDAAINVGLPVVYRIPVGPLTPATTGSTTINKNGPQGLSFFADGARKGLMLPLNISATAQDVARLFIDGPLTSSDGYPYVSATVEDALGAGAQPATQDSSLVTLIRKASANTTQPAAAANNLFYCQYFPNGNGDGSGTLFFNGFLKDMATYSNVSPAKSPQTLATATSGQVGVGGLQAMTITNVKGLATSARTAVYSFTTSQPSTERIQRGPQAPLFASGDSIQDVSYRATNHSTFSQAGLTVGGTQYARITAWAPGYTTVSADVSLTTPAVQAGAAVKSSPVVYNGVTYFGSDDGKLYAMNVAAGTAASGFPATVSTAVPVGKIQSRPALRFLSDGSGGYEAGPTLFFTSDDGFLYAYKTDGTQRWKTQIPASAFSAGVTAVTTTSTPAIYTSDTDYAYVGATGYSGSATFSSETRVLKFKASDGTFIAASPALNTRSGDAVKTTLTSPAFDGNYVFVSADNVQASAATPSPNTVFSLMPDLTVRTAEGGAEGASSSPFIRAGAGVMYVGTHAGNVYALNTSNGNPTATFGSNPTTGGTGGSGVVNIKSADTATPVNITSNLYVYGGKVYFSDANNNFYNLNQTDGSGPGAAVTGVANTYLLYKTVTTGQFSGVAIDPTANTGHGALYAAGTDKTFYEIALDAPATKSASYNLYAQGVATGANTTPTIDVSTGNVLVADDNGLIYRFPRL